MKHIKEQQQAEFIYHIINNYQLSSFDHTINYFENKKLDVYFRSIIKLYSQTGNIITNNLRVQEVTEDLGNKLELSAIDKMLKFKPTTTRDILKVLTYQYTEEAFGEIEKQLNEVVVEKSDLEKSKTIDEFVYDNVPSVLKELTGLFKSDRQKDIILLSTLTTVSILFDKLYFYNTDGNTHPNLYTFIGAPASNGKGIVSNCKSLLKQYEKREDKDNNKRVAQSLEQSEQLKKTVNPKLHRILTASDNSYAAFVDTLDDNEGKALIIATEINQITGNNGQDWGNYDNALRLAFHNEEISKKRKESYIKVENPYISVVATGTIDQISEMFANKQENGLFSRVIFYLFQTDDMYWECDDERFDRNNNKKTIKDIFEDKSQLFLDMYDYFNKKIEINVTKEQWKLFNKTMQTLNINGLTFQGEKLTSTNRRMASIFKRILMILTVIRYYEDNVLNSVKTPPTIFNDMFDSVDDIKEPCSLDMLMAKDIDIEISLNLCTTLLEHSKLLFDSFKISNIETKPVLIIKKDDKQQLLDEMGDMFTTKDIIKIGKEKYDISDSTLERFLGVCIKNVIVKKIKRGEYQKIK